MSTHRLSFVSTLAVALLTAGCDTLHQTQYTVGRASIVDEMAIKRIVGAAASGAGLLDKTEASDIPGTIAYYLEPVPHFPVSLGVRLVADITVVDLACFHPGAARPSAFRIAESQLTSALTNRFGARLGMPDRSHQVPLEIGVNLDTPPRLYWAPLQQ